MHRYVIGYMLNDYKYIKVMDYNHKYDKWMG